MNFSDKQHLSSKAGNEKFNFENQNLEYSLLDFWRWSVSDILSNATRGILAEFIVAKALNADTAQIRTEWDAYDLISTEGSITLNSLRKLSNILSYGEISNEVRFKFSQQIDRIPNNL